MKLQRPGTIVSITVQDDDGETSHEETTLKLGNPNDPRVDHVRFGESLARTLTAAMPNQMYALACAIRALAESGYEASGAEHETKLEPLVDAAIEYAQMWDANHKRITDLLDNPPETP